MRSTFNGLPGLFAGEDTPILTARDAEDTTVTSFSLDLLAIGESLHGRCCKPQLAALLLRRSDSVKGSDNAALKYQ